MEKTMTIEDLLKPRYKVIAPMPFSKFKVGDILSRMMVQYAIDKEAELMWRRVSGEDHFGGQSVGIPIIRDPETYPHLFKKLEWWEERKQEEMPLYVKRIEGGRVYKLSEATQRYYFGFEIDYPMTDHCVTFKECQPATETEYQAYLSKQK